MIVPGHGAAPLLLAGLVGRGTAPVDAVGVPWGYQSGAMSLSGSIEPSKAINDDTFAGSFRYDPEGPGGRGMVYLAGSTYGYFEGIQEQYFEERASDGGRVAESDCYVAAIRPPSGDRVDDAASSEWEGEVMFARKYGEPDVPDACSAVAPVVLNKPPSWAPPGSSLETSQHLVVLGHSEEGGLMTSLRAKGSDRASAYGYVMDMEVVEYSGGEEGAGGQSPRDAALVGGHLFHQSQVQYPVAIASAPPGSGPSNGRTELYVVMLISDDTQENKRWENAIYHPDLTAGGGGGVQKYSGGGEGYEIEIHKLGWKSDLGEFVSESNGDDVTESMVSIYTQEYATKDDKSVRISDLVYIPHLGPDGSRDDVLLMAGYTRGYGAAFGSSQPGTPDSDGFVTKIDPATGREQMEMQDMSDTDMAHGNTYSARISTQNGRVDVVHGICVDQTSDDVREAYIVGSTTGVIDPDAKGGGEGILSMFVAKLDIDSMNLEWKQQYGSKSGQENTYGTGCAVIPGGGGLYVGGGVEDGGILDVYSLKDGGGLNSAGGADVFVVKLSSSGKAEWAKQIGTDQEERLATGGGIDVDEDGDALLFGTTRGSMMRARGSETRNDEGELPADAFVMSIGKNGEHRDPVERLAAGTAGGAGGTTHSTVSAPTERPSFPEQVASGNADAPDKAASSMTGITVGAISAAVAAALVFFVYRVGVRKSQDSSLQGQNNDHITKYTKGFEDIDVAIRPSATGGWHGMIDLGDDAQAQLGKKHVPPEVVFELGKAADGARSTGERPASPSEAAADLVRQSLFLDDDDNGRKPSGGLVASGGEEPFQDEPGSDKWGAGYSGLVESYNESWQDRAPGAQGSEGAQGLDAKGVSDTGDSEIV